MRTKKWKGDPKRYQWKEWRKAFGINPKTAAQFQPFMVASKNNRKGGTIKVKMWRNRK
tara:strand:+ start:72 stop:245 length:174 start_codon:yes stop_codon:yes gene_type:complete